MNGGGDKRHRTMKAGKNVGNGDAGDNSSGRGDGGSDEDGNIIYLVMV